MHSSNLFAEGQNRDPEPDENTIIVESWLDFVAARSNNSDLSSAKGLNAEIKDKIQELCVRIDAMLEERKSFCAELERMTQSDSVTEITDKLLINFPPAKPRADLDVGGKSADSLSSKHQPESKRSLSGWKFATRILQTLKIYPKSQTNFE